MKFKHISSTPTKAQHHTQGKESFYMDLGSIRISCGVSVTIKSQEDTQILAGVLDRSEQAIQKIRTKTEYKKWNYESNKD